MARVVFSLRLYEKKNSFVYMNGEIKKIKCSWTARQSFSVMSV